MSGAWASLRKVLQLAQALGLAAPLPAQSPPIPPPQAVAAAGGASPAQALPESGHPRLFVLSDIGNEPDDQMSLVRLLLYTDTIDLEGFGATTSVWQRKVVHPEIAQQVIAAYAQIEAQLRANAPGYPTATALAARVHPGVAGYGLAAIDPAHPSPAASALEQAARKSDPRPLWVALWGGRQYAGRDVGSCPGHHGPGRIFRARCPAARLRDQRSG